jgi:hypothetical protein
MIDWSISVGNILTILGMVAAAGGIMFTLGRQSQKFDGFSSQMGEFKEEIKKQNDILSTLAVQNIRIDMHDKWIDELRRGIGVILPPDNRV